MKIVDGYLLANELRKAILQNDRIQLAIAFWGKGAMDALGLSSKTNAEIICNLKMGGTNPFEIGKLVHAGLDVYALDDLHSKIGVVGDLGFVGSSNASTNGMGIEGKGAPNWRELNVLFRDEEHVSDLRDKFEAYKICSGKALAPNDERLQNAERAWQLRQKVLRDTNPHPKIKPSLIEQVLNDTPKNALAGIYLVVHDEITDEEEARNFDAGQNEIKAQYGNHFEAYWDWPELPIGYFISVERKSSGKRYEVCGFYEMSEAFPSYQSSETTFQLVKEVNEIPGFSGFKTGEKRRWHKIAKDLSSIDKYNGDFFIQVGDIKDTI